MKRLEKYKPHKQPDSVKSKALHKAVEIHIINMTHSIPFYPVATSQIRHRQHQWHRCISGRI